MEELFSATYKTPKFNNRLSDPCLCYVSSAVGEGFSRTRNIIIRDLESVLEIIPRDRLGLGYCTTRSAEFRSGSFSA